MSKPSAVDTLPEETVKAGVIAMLQRLPDDVSYEEILDAIELRREIEQGLKEIDAGDVVSHEEVKRRVASWRT
jgi:predicted transcriptional regulator